MRGGSTRASASPKLLSEASTIEEVLVTGTRALSDGEIEECTGARLAGDVSARANGQPPDKKAQRYEVQLDGLWIEVDHASYERVRVIQDSCA